MAAVQTTELETATALLNIALKCAVVTDTENIKLMKRLLVEFVGSRKITWRLVCCRLVVNCCKQR